MCLAVNRARRGTRGGENKIDPRDARVIADQLRIREDLRPINAAIERAEVVRTALPESVGVLLFP
jgi:hypothetical protein